MEHNTPSNIRDENPHDPESNDDGIRDAKELNGFTHAQNSFYQAENSHRSAQHASTTGQGIAIPLYDQGPMPRWIRTKPPSIFGERRQAAGRPDGETTGDSGKYAPSLPFEEAGPTSSVWRAYLDERYSHDTDTFENKRGRLNILLVFAGLFSAVVTTFISQSSLNLQPNYQQMSALLLFDQINIQRALANGTSLDHITTSGTDPNAPFTPKHLDSVINGLWFTSLTLSLGFSFLAIVGDRWYASYLSPIAGNTQVRARTWHFRYNTLIHSHVRTILRFLPSMLNIAIYLFLIGLVLYLKPLQRGIAIMIGTIFTLLIIVIVVTGRFPRKYSESRYKKTVRRNWSSSNSGRKHRKIQDPERYTAERSHIENDVDALLWMYKESSTSAIHHLVIHALAGLPPDCIGHANEAFSPHWDEIRNEKDRLLMDCMELSRDGLTRWIPKDIPNIDRRIEPLLRLEILFPELCRKSPSRLFGGHNLDFSNELSNNLAITLSSTDNPHIQNPRDQKRVLMDALADNSLHHPLVWEKLLDRYYVDETKLFHNVGDAFTIEMFLSLATSIYPPQDSRPESYSCTLADTLIISHKNEILKGLLAFFSPSESPNGPVDLKRRLSLAIVYALVPNSAPSAFNSHQNHLFHNVSTISKYRLLGVVLHGINKDIHSHPIDLHLKQWRTDVFYAILSFIMSDLFTGRSLSNSEDSEFKYLFWTCRAYALAFMASLMGGSPEACVVGWNVQWAAKPLFLNILRVIHDKHVEDAPRLFALPVFPGLPRRFRSLLGIVSFLLGQAFSRGIFNAYEAFEHERSLCYIADRSNLHPELIEGLRGYITGLSEAKAGKLPDIQRNDLLKWHIEDLHQTPVIRCICASIARSGTKRGPILSSLASIAPNDDKWSTILEILNSPNHEYSVRCYTLHRADKGTRKDVGRWKKNMKRIVSILAKCLEEEKGRNTNINQPSTSSNRLTEGLETHHGSGWPLDPNTDVELGVFRIGNVDAT